MDGNGKKRSASCEASELRRQAEQRLRTKKTEPVEAMAGGDVRALVHELQVHQIELEMQNEKLCLAQAAAQELSHKYCHLLDLSEGADIGITLVDPALNIVMANKKQAEIVGRSPDELVGKKCFREYEGLDAVCPHCPGLKAMAGGIPVESERAGKRKDGRAFTVLVKASPLFDQEGKPRGFIEVVQDITERRRAEELLQRAKKPPRRPTVPRASSSRT